MKTSFPAALPARRTAMAALIATVCSSAFAASDVVISQVYGGGGNSGATYKNDFVELFNRSSNPVTIGGWSVQYNSATSTTGAWQVTQIPAGTVLQPGQYLLVQEAVGAGGSTVLPNPDVTGTIAMSATAGKVALVGNTTALAVANPSGGAVKDVFGFGNTATAFEGTVGPGLSNTLAAFRGEYGCADTDNNAADFSTAAPAPRNRATAAHVCGTPVVLPIVASCPANLPAALGNLTSAALSATDADGIVNRAIISSSPVAGISLQNFVAADAAGGTATVNLNVDASVPVGSYPVAIQFGNDQAQSASCSVNVNVAAPQAVTHSIMQIQGNGATSPYVNTIQTTEGVVTLKVGSGFFMQDENGDGDPTTSDGIFVYLGSNSTGAKVGDKVRVTATVQEFTPTGAPRSITELSNVTAVFGIGAGRAITPTNIDLPFANLGQVEGMLVHFNRPLTVSQAEFLGTRGEVSLSSGRLESPTNRYAPRSPEAIALAAANAQNLIVLDDGVTTQPASVPYLGQDNTLRVGDSVSNLTGVVDYAAGGSGPTFKLQPTVAPTFSRDNPRTGAPSVLPGNVKVASANVLNFFTVFTNGSDVWGRTGQGCALGANVSKNNCRGADNLDEFQRQKTKIVNELKGIDADVFGLMEIQNNGEATVSYLVDELNAAIGSPTYAVVPKPADTGTDAIRVAMIYKPAKLSMVGGALSDGNTLNNRPPMAQTFQLANGEKFSLVVNHLKSKGSCPTGTGPDADQHDGQSCWTATRVQQAQRLVNTFVPQVVAAAGDPDVLLVGDFNALGMEDPIAAITSTGYVNQLERFIRPRGMPYSFIFDSQSGYLDHALASASLNAQVIDAAEWHNNADEPTVIDYNADGKPAGVKPGTTEPLLYSPLPYRASDHDPVVVSLNLQPKFVDVSASVSTSNSGFVYNRATAKYVSTFTVTNTSGAVMSGPLQLQLDGLPAGISLSNATGLHNGAPYITLNAGSLAAGASTTVTLNFSKSTTTNISYAAKVFRGTF